ncbi:unnamed protein product, partial [Didymodactylos carnosus]
MLLHEAKFQTNEFDIAYAETLTNDAVQIVQRLVKIQQTIPQSCKFDSDKEGKDLRNMICVDSVRIEVKKVEYRDDKPKDKQGNRDMWDNKIELIGKGYDVETVEGRPKPLKSWRLSNYVEDLFVHSIQLPADTTSGSAKAWILQLLAGNSKDEKWTKMAVIPLRHADLSSTDGREFICEFGQYRKSTITLLITPSTTIRLFEMATETTEPEITDEIDKSMAATTEEKLLATSEDDVKKDRFCELRANYQLLTPLKRNRQLGNRIMDLKFMCQEIESTIGSVYKMPTVPTKYSIPKRDHLVSMPVAAMNEDVKLINVSSPPTHHFLMLQLTSKYEDLNGKIVQTLEMLNKTVDDNELNEIQHGIGLEFDSADTLRQEMEKFKAIFRFEKLAAALSQLHDTSIVIQKALISSRVFRQTLERSLENLQRSGSLVQLIDFDGSISKENIDKLFTRQLRTLLQDGLALARDELNFGLQIYRILI